MMKSVVMKRFPAELWQRVKSQAALEGRTLQDVVAEAIQQYLDKSAKAA
jgi:predicted DNA-binding protein